MEYRTLEHYLLGKPEAVKEFPFGPEAAVFKVVGKMFALIAWQNDPLTITLKCDPDEAYALRDMYDTVAPGYHMNKEHWNTVLLDGSVPDGVVEELVVASYDLIVKKLRKSDREKLLHL